MLASTNGIAQAERNGAHPKNDKHAEPPKRADDREAKRRHDQMQKRRQQLEASIEGKEAERAGLASEMNDPNFYIQRKDADELIGRYQQLGREIERLYAELEKLEIDAAPSAFLKKPAIVCGNKSDYLSASYLGCGVAKATDNKISDRELVAAMANGDADALRALSSRYARMLGALAYRFVKNESDAEEIAADALWQAWREAALFDPSRSSVSAWLVMLGRSRAIDRFRAARARRPPENPAAGSRAGARCALGAGSRRARQNRQEGGGRTGSARARTSRARLLLGPDSDGDRRQGWPSARHGENRMRTALIKLRDALRRLR